MAAPRKRKTWLKLARYFFPTLTVVTTLLTLQFIVFEYDNKLSTKPSTKLTMVDQEKPRSMRVFFDEQGNRITERLYDVKDHEEVNITIVETSEQIMNQTANSNPNLNYTRMMLGNFEQGMPSENTIRDPLIHPSTRGMKIDMKSEVEYLGVLLDAGRHYFPLSWIYSLLDHLELLGYNLVHFRLTDDQAFNIRLDSHPELAQPAFGSDGNVYTPSELRQLVVYAKRKGIVIMPEINIPGHAGGWAGAIPRIVIPCVGFICEKGYGLTLNVSHPELLPLLRDVFLEVKQIFSTTPFYHLGGDELHMSSDCLQESGSESPDYDKFEIDLGLMLNDIGIAQAQVVRWEMTGQLNEDDSNSSITRIKGIDHFWYSRSYQDSNVSVTPRVFCSEGLYFDTNQNEDAWVIYQKAKSMRAHRYKPIAIVAGTFELGVKYWFDRNVVGRLLAVAMGSANENFDNEQEFLERYHSLCKLVDLPDEICAKAGAPMVDFEIFRADWAETFKAWRESLCDRLVIKESVPYFLVSSRSISSNQRIANSLFWDRLVGTESGNKAAAMHQRDEQRQDPRILSLNRIRKHTVNFTGIILDLVDFGSFSEDSLSQMKTFMHQLSLLGFNTVQLRIMNDYGFAVDLFNYQEMAFGQNAPWKIDSVNEIIQYAASIGIQVIPELTIAHRAGGWYMAAPVVQCPHHFCEQTKGLALDTSNGAILPVVLSVLQKLRDSFSSSFLHLGYDEREESMACVNEANAQVDFEKFELKVAKLLAFHGFSGKRCIRWENNERRLYEHRFGDITHYRKSIPKQGEHNRTFFISTGLDLSRPLSTLETAWDLYQHVQKLVSIKPLGVLASVSCVPSNLLGKLNIPQRLLALAIGVSISDLDETDFRKSFLEFCKEAAMEDCELLGTIENGKFLADVLGGVESQRHKDACMNRLRNRTIGIPREGILVEHGADVYGMGVTLVGDEG